MEQEGIIQTAEVDFRVSQRGAQPQAVFLHGFGTDLHTWDSVWAAMGDALPALRYDLRGYGRSVTREEGAFTHADDLLCLLDTIGLDVIDLVGVSMGGSIALNFTLEHPQRVRRLVLISPGLVAWEWSGQWRALWQPIVDQARAGALQEARHLWWMHPLFESTRRSAAAPALFESIMQFTGDQWLGDHHRLMYPDVDRLHRLTAPTLLLTGGRDMADFRLIAELLEASASTVQRIDHTDLGHLLHLEDAAGCAGELLSFLADATNSTTACVPSR
jgi:pimeloyl-ACP methyl ester carboxylesterase